MSQHGNIVKLKDWLSKQIIGQERLLDRLLIALLADGHLLVEGAPGLAKTKAIKDLSRSVEGFPEFSSSPTCYPAISQARKYSDRRMAPSAFSKAQFFTT